MSRAARRRVGTFLVLVVSTAFSLAVAVFLLKGYEALLGADIPYTYFVEPRPVLWELDGSNAWSALATRPGAIFGVESSGNQGSPALQVPLRSCVSRKGALFDLRSIRRMTAPRWIGGLPRTAGW